MIVGEAEIAGQIRRAADAARRRRTLGPFLEGLVAGARRASGRARSETRIGEGAMSAATAAVSIVERMLGSLAAQTVLVVGAGEAGRQALARLARRQTRRLIVTSRSPYHARQAAASSGATVVDLDRIVTAIAEADAVIVATRGSSPAVDVQTCRAARQDRSTRPLVFVDLSVPRAVDPAVREVQGVSLVGVDDLGEVVRESIARRAAEVPRVERIVHDEAARAYARFAARRERQSA
jgi:glutamyl-tRNA reductase